jgi:hypothetical protein
VHQATGAVEVANLHSVILCTSLDWLTDRIQFSFGWLNPATVGKVCMAKAFLPCIPQGWNVVQYKKTEELNPG